MNEKKKSTHENKLLSCASVVVTGQNVHVNFVLDAEYACKLQARERQHTTCHFKSVCMNCSKDSCQSVSDTCQLHETSVRRFDAICPPESST